MKFFTILLIIVISHYLVSCRHRAYSNEKNKKHTHKHSVKLNKKFVKSTKEDLEDFAYYKCKKDKTIALTFDDGPDGKVTTSLIDLFKKKNIKVTFFIVARRLLNNKKNVAAALKALENGHEIASHTFDHSSFTREKPKNVSLCEFLKFQVQTPNYIFKQFLNVYPKYIRPPYGDIDIKSGKIIKNWGFKSILWNLDTYDWKWDNEGRDRLKIAESYEKEFKSNRIKSSYISLQHDKGRNVEANTERYNYIINMIKEKGYKFVTMSECLEDLSGPYFKETPDFSNC